MPIQFNCPKCGQKLTLTSSKPGDWLDCPKCEAAIMVPGSAPKPKPTPVPPPTPTPVPDDYKPPWLTAPTSSPTPQPAEAPRGFWANRRVQLGIIAGGATLLLSTLVLLVMVLQQPDQPPEQAHNDTPATNPTPAPPAPPTPSATTSTITPPAPVTRPTPPEPVKPPEPRPQQPVALPVAPEPHTVAIAPPPHAPNYAHLDQFGNPIGQNQALAKQGEFKGQRLLFWSPHTGAGEVMFARSNPMWKALEDAGFTVRREFGKFNAAWLKQTDQLWILSTASEEVLGQQLADIMQPPEDYLRQFRALTNKEIDDFLKSKGKSCRPDGRIRTSLMPTAPTRH